MKNLEKLVKGYKHFLKNEDTAQFRSLARGQSPKVMVIGCCDSRVNPDLIFNAAPGELFVVRNVANLVPPYEPDESYHGTSAALEFAVTGLKVEHIVIMGHSSCGGVKACCDAVSGAPVGGVFIPKWTSMLQTCARDLLDSGHDVTAVEKAAVQTSLENLKSFPFIAERLVDRTLSIHGVYFDIKHAQLYALDKDAGTFIPLD